jgi:hypothetical protein
MNAAVVIGTLYLLGAACIISGVAVLAGLGPALLTGGACAALLGFHIDRGRPT